MPMFPRRAWLVLAPVAVFVCAVLMLSCGGGSSSSPTFTSAPPGGFLQSIQLCDGPPSSPFPTFTGPASPTPTPVPSLTPCPSALPTSLPMGCTTNFHALGTFLLIVGNASTTFISDISTNSSTFWGTSNGGVLTSNGAGSYTAATQGTSDIQASSSGLASSLLGVTVLPAGVCPR